MASLQFNAFGECPHELLHFKTRRTSDECMHWLFSSASTQTCGGSPDCVTFLSMLTPFLFCSTCKYQTRLRMPALATRPEEKKRSMSVCSNATEENVSPPSQDWPMTWTSSEFARPSKRISVATGPSRRMKMSEMSFSCREIKERMSRPFWWTNRFVMRRALCCTDSSLLAQAV